MRNTILDKIHEGHLGMVKCNSRARDSVWWPGISKQIEELVRNCILCLKTRPDTVQPMLGTPLPDSSLGKKSEPICVPLKGKIT